MPDLTLSSQFPDLPVSSNESIDEWTSLYVDRFNIEIDKDWSVRQSRLHILELFYKSKIYNKLSPWHKEYEGGTYKMLVDRRPSVIYPMPRIVVNESCSMLFGREHFPIVCSDDESSTGFLEYVARQSNLKTAMLSAARKGALGSACVLVKVLKGKFYFDVLSTLCLDPVFDQHEPFNLVGLTERKKVLGETLVAKGFDIPAKDFKKVFWAVREWTQSEEIYYIPYPAEGEQETRKKRVRDHRNSTTHNFGFLPAIWMHNSPDCDDIDGECTFEPIIDMSIETDYQLSQLGRLLRYNADPTMVIKDSVGLEGKMLVKGTGALELSKDGDAYLMEMSSSSTKAIIDYARCLREFALETVRGNRANPDKLSALHSGKALQMLNSPMISFVDEQRLCYGDNGLLRIFKMVLQICQTDKVDINYDSFSLGDMEKSLNTLSLDWPDWYPPTPQDDLQESQTLIGYVSNGILSKETSLKKISEQYNVIDTNKELTDAKKDAISDAKIKNLFNFSKNPVKPMDSVGKDGVDRQKKVINDSRE